MQSTDTAQMPPPNVLLLLAVAGGLWGLIFLGIASFWPREVNRPGDAVVRDYNLQRAVPSDPRQPQVNVRARAKLKAKRRKRQGPSLAARVFAPSISAN